MIITAGIYKGRNVVAPDEKIVRPTLSKIRESIFNVLFSIMDFEDKSFLDMYAGSGIMGLEAISRGFDSVLALENSPKVSRILKENYQALKIKPNLIVGNSLKILPKLQEKFDVIYIDPPYFSGVYEDSLKQIRECKFLKDDGIVILEHVTDVNWSAFGFDLIKQKKYSKKLVTFLEQAKK